MQQLGNLHPPAPTERVNLSVIDVKGTATRVRHDPPRGAQRLDPRLRIVAAPGGIAFVEDERAADGDRWSEEYGARVSA